MNKMLLLGGALAATFSMSAAVSAQNYSGPYGNNGSYARQDGGVVEAVRSVNLRDDQQRAVRDILRSTNGDRREAVRQIAGVLDDGQRRTFFAALRNDQNGGYQNGGYQNGGYQNGGYQNGGGDRDDRNGGYRNGNGTVGVVDSFNAFDLQLRNGTHVRLHQGTVINPTGTTIQPGERVSVRGHFDSNGTLEADRIDVNPGRFRN